jgi:hypothetical protein
MVWMGMFLALFVTTVVAADLRPRGVPVVWGNMRQDQVSLAGRDLVSVAATRFDAYGLQADGKAVLLLTSGNSEMLPYDATNMVAISGGASHYVGLKRDGTVVAWGARGNVFQDVIVTPPAGLSNVIAVSAGDTHSLALKTDGTVVSWGHNFWGSIAVPAGLSNVVSITAGRGVSLVAFKDGTVWGWGNLLYNGFSQASDLTGVQNVETGTTFYSLALFTNKTVFEWKGRLNDLGWKHYPPDLTNVVTVSSSFGQIYALKEDGTLAAWGDNSQLQATPPRDLRNIIAVDGGSGFGVALVRKPVIANQPKSHVVRQGEALPIKIELLAADDYVYTLFLNGIPVLSTNRSQFSVEGVRLEHSGTVSVRVAHPRFGAAEANIGTLTVLAAPTGSTDPPAAVLRHDEVATFTARLMGSQPIQYEWKCLKSGAILSTNAAINMGWDPGCPTLVLRAWNSEGSIETYADVLLLGSGVFSQVEAADDQFRFEITVEPKRTYRLQASADSVRWTTVLTFQARDESFHFGEHLAPSAARMFYRLISP